MKYLLVVLRGRPDAGSPRVRFDEGEVASAKPRRGSQFRKSKFMPMVCWGLLGLAAGATDYTWLAEPLSANWLGDANWNAGMWSAGTGDTAAFGASTETEVNVNGSVALAGLSVSGADYAFTNGELTVNGAINVGAGATATVASRLGQDSADAAKRLSKTGDGTLVLNAPEGVTNDIRQLRLAGGTLHIAGGEHVISGNATVASEAGVTLSLAKGRMLVDGGAHVVVSNTNSYVSNSGVDLVVSNATVDVSRVDEFLNGFNDNNTFGCSTSSVTIETNGVFVAKKLRIGKSTKTTDYGVLNLRRGGTLRASVLTMDAPANNYRGTVNFDGGVWEVSTNGWSGNNARIGTSSKADNYQWKNVALNVCEGGLHILNPNGFGWYYGGFRSAANPDGGVHIRGGSVAYWLGNNSYNGGTWLEGGGVIFAYQEANDSCLGELPAEPTDNIFFAKNTCFFFGMSGETHPNRNFLIQTNVTASIGTQDGSTGRFRGTFTSAGTNGVLCASSMWTGWNDLNPPDNRTNLLNKLRVDGRLRISSGTTLVRQDCGANIDDNCPLFLYGNGSSFNDARGNLTMTGGVLKVTKFCYAIVKNYGQLNVLGGVFDTTAAHEWINGLGGAGRTTVANGGELRSAAVRISQYPNLDSSTGLPICSVNVNTGGIMRVNNFYIDTNYAAPRGCLNLNGGTVIPRDSRETFLGTDNGRWTNILVRVCEGGAIFDTTNFNVSVKQPLLSGAERDGGLTKKGSGTLTLANTNAYNGATTCAGGRLVFSHANGYPGGDLVFASAALAAKDSTSPLVTMPELVFRDGCTVKVSDAESELACEAMRGVKTVATFEMPLAKVPACVCTDAQGAPIGRQLWKLSLADGGRTLRIAYSRGTVLVLR